MIKCLASRLFGGPEVARETWALVLGYVIATAASVVTGLPVKWIEDRSENLQADSFARDYHMDLWCGGKKCGYHF